MMFKQLFMRTPAPPESPRDVGQVTVTFHWTTPQNMDGMGVEYATTVDFQGTWTKKYDDGYGGKTTDPRDHALSFINGTLPVQTKHGWVPRHNIHYYEVSERTPFVLDAPNVDLWGNPL